MQDWDLSINRGILTGYNDAFIIDEATKNSLIEADSKSAELIRPILRGKDIKRYTYNFANLYLICTFPSKHYDIDKYPAIRDYLLSFDKRRLAQTGEKDIDGIEGFNARKKTGNKWFETQDQINYSDDFNKQKLMYSEIVQEPHFYYDDKIHFYPEATTFIMNGDNLKPLLLILNSKITFNIFKLFYAGGGLGENGIRYKKAFLLNLRLPKLDKTAIATLESYYEKLNANNFQVETSFEILNEIEFYISKLYNLSKSEIDYLLN